MAQETDNLKHTRAFIAKRRKAGDSPEQIKLFEDMLACRVIQRTDTPDNKSNFTAFFHTSWRPAKDDTLYRQPGTLLFYNRAKRQLQLFDGLAGEQRYREHGGAPEHDEVKLGPRLWPLAKAALEASPRPSMTASFGFPDYEIHGVRTYRHGFWDQKLVQAVGYNLTDEFKNCFNRDAEDQLREFLQKIDHEALSCFDELMPYMDSRRLETAFRYDFFNWLSEPKDATVRARRRRAFSQLGGARRLLFSLTPFYTSDASDGFCRAIPELERCIDAGVDVFKALKDYSGISASFMQKNAHLLEPFVNPLSSGDTLLLVLGMVEANPKLGLPREGSHRNDDPFHRCLNAVVKLEELAKVQDMPVRHRGRFIMHALQSLRKPHWEPITWENIYDYACTTELSLQTARILMNAQHMEAHLFLPVYLQQLQRSGVVILTPAHISQAEQVTRKCAELAASYFGKPDLQQILAINAIDTQLKEYRKFAASKDPSLENDAGFKAVGFALGDTDTQEKIFEMYRNQVFSKAWQRYGTLNEMLMDSGIYALLRDAAKAAAQQTAKATAPEPK